jgi:putative ABC transport system permease protein
MLLRQQAGEKDNVFINERRVAYVDSTFFDMFTIPSIAGATHTALNEPNTVVITRIHGPEILRKTDVIGKTIETNDKSPVYKSPP